MDDREFYLKRLKEEKGMFLSAIRALSKGDLDYKPHERSPTAAQVLGTIVFEHSACCELLDTGRAEWKPGQITSADQAARDFEKYWDQIDAKVAALDDAGWTKVGGFYYGGKKVLDSPVGQFLWFILFDAIHHRGQISAYIRPMGGKVPAIYGPSADSRT